MKKFGIGLYVLMLSFVFGVGLTYFLQVKHIGIIPQTAHAQSKINPKSLTPDQLKNQSVESDEILTNLADGKFTKMRFQFVGDSKSTANEIKLRQFQVQSYLLQKLSDMTSDELQSNKGTDELMKGLKNYLNGNLSKGSVVAVYLTEKMIQ